jgi:biopolymer transport protein ExbD
MRSKLRRHHARTDPELDITAFLNLMVVLVPFLLLSAVFSQMTILELNLPSAPSAQNEDEKKPKLALELIVRETDLIVNDRVSGPLKVLPLVDDKHDWAGLATKLREIKVSFPDITDINVLLQPDTPYDIMIQAMDSVRLYRAEENGQSREYELFPDIAIGDAPALPGVAQ